MAMVLETYCHCLSYTSSAQTEKIAHLKGYLCSMNRLPTSPTQQVPHKRSACLCARFTVHSVVQYSVMHTVSSVLHDK